MDSLTVKLHEGVAFRTTCLRVELDPEQPISEIFLELDMEVETYSTFETGPASEKTPASCSSETSLRSLSIRNTMRGFGLLWDIGDKDCTSCISRHVDNLLL